MSRIVGAYLAASVAAGLALALELHLLVLIGTLLQGRWPPNAAVSLSGVHLTLALGGNISILIIVFAFAPAVVAIAVAEACRLRSAAFYACTGVIAAMVAWGTMMRLDRLVMERPELPPLRLARGQAFVLLAIAAAGLIGGLVYWRIADKSAGDWQIPRGQ